MSLVKSAINQVGRDMGKVVSNSLFKDAHSTPIRMTGSNNSNRQQRRKVLSEFDKAINFQTGFRPNTLITKLTGAYTEMKNTSNSYVADGYLDNDEYQSLFGMIDRYNQKTNDIYDILDLDEESNAKEIAQLTKLTGKFNLLIKDVLEKSAVGCGQKAKELHERSQEVKGISFFPYVFLNAVWMGNYARTGVKNWGATIVANFFSLFTFGLIHAFMAFYGLITFSSESRSKKRKKNNLLEWATLEIKRESLFTDMSKQYEIMAQDLLPS